VEFNTPEEAEENIQKNEMEIRGRKIYVDYANKKSE